MRYALLLMLCGCAANQSAFPITPRAPAFSPVEDAPITIGQPGQVAPAPERSPHTRVLPQTPETMRQPGIWAGDNPSTPVPERRKGDPIPHITLIDVDVPVASAAKDAWDTVPTEQCARVADEDLRTHGVLQKALDLPAAKRKCVAAILVFKCIKWMSQYEWMDRTKWADGAAIKWVQRACTERAKGPDTDAVLEGLGIRGGAERWTN